MVPYLAQSPKMSQFRPSRASISTITTLPAYQAEDPIGAADQPDVIRLDPPPLSPLPHNEAFVIPAAASSLPKDRYKLHFFIGGSEFKTYIKRLIAAGAIPAEEGWTAITTNEFMRYRKYKKPNGDWKLDWDNSGGVIRVEVVCVGRIALLTALAEFKKDRQPHKFFPYEVYKLEDY